MFYEQVFRELQKHEVRYLVVGGVAVNLYGVLRTTADLDLIVHLADDENVRRFVAAMKELKYKPRVPVNSDDFADPQKRQEWMIEKGAVVFTWVAPQSYEQVDVFLHDPIVFEEAYRRRRVVSADDFEISVVSLKDLKKLKQAAGRAKDLSDLKQLSKVEQLNESNG
jgi:predicted nucleotidyltransferase